MRWTLFFLVACRFLGATELDEYVSTVDPAYRWEVVETVSNPWTTTYLVRLASLQWRTAEEVDRPVWEHWLTIVEPMYCWSNQGLLHIRGGNHEMGIPPEPSQALRDLAQKTGSVTAQLWLVPNQNLCFADEKDPRFQTKGRKEDQIIAYTWNKYLQTGDASWIAQFPMTKSVVAAMDAIQEFTNERVTGFVLAGASKRGWTAWTTAAVDPRVTGVAAFVIDLMNLKQSMEHHYCAYGCWSYALQDYHEMGLFDHWHNPALDHLFSLVEPFHYRNRLIMPKLVVNSTGDEFFLPDSSQYYFHDLPGPKHLRYVPNTNHSLQNCDALTTFAAFYASLLTDSPLPECQWSFSPNGALSVQSTVAPISAKLWSTHNAEARDFRLSSIGSSWTSQELDPSTALEVTLQTPSEGWSAHLVELTFQGPSGLPFTQTTDVFVLPNSMPFSGPGSKLSDKS